MSEVESYYKREKWYNKSIFPLVPIITIKKSEEHNTSGFTFMWLFFQFWTLDTFQFELAVNIDTHWGIGVTFVLPYFRGVIAIPCSEKIRTFMYKYSSRKCRSVR